MHRISPTRHRHVPVTTYYAQEEWQQRRPRPTVPRKRARKSEESLVRQGVAKGTAMGGAVVAAVGIGLFTGIICAGATRNPATI